MFSLTAVVSVLAFLAYLRKTGTLQRLIRTAKPERTKVAKDKQHTLFGITR
jgi:hypothetical protein